MAALVAAFAFVMLPALSQAYLPTWTANVLPVLFGLGAISVAKYPDGLLAEQARRLRHLLLRLTPGRLDDPNYADLVDTGSTEVQTAEPTALIAEHAS